MCPRRAGPWYSQQACHLCSADLTRRSVPDPARSPCQSHNAGGAAQRWASVQHSAAIQSHGRSVLTICIPAPISPSWDAASRIVTFPPALAMAMEAITPPIPAPTIPTSSSCPAMVGMCLLDECDFEDQCSGWIAGSALQLQVDVELDHQVYQEERLISDQHPYMIVRRALAGGLHRMVAHKTSYERRTNDLLSQRRLGIIKPNHLPSALFPGCSHPAW